MIELELLAAAWAMWKCRAFLLGLPTFKLYTDHRPLIPILNDYPMSRIENRRLFALKEKMEAFDYVAVWIPGKENVAADALSRSPVDKPTAEDELANTPKYFTARTATVGLIAGSDGPVSDSILTKIRAAADADPTLQQLRSTILEGFPNDKCNLALTLRPYWDMRDRLAIDEGDGMIVLGSRVVIPRAAVPEMLQILLKMHQGATKMRQRARITVYWPGMDIDIANAARTCESCVSRLPSLPAEPLRPHETATRPFQFVHGDVGEDDGQHFLVLVDTFSGWPYIAIYPDKKTTSFRLIGSCREYFSAYGAPVKLWSDNASILASSEFQSALQSFNVQWGSSTPYYAQSNGVAEADIAAMSTLVAGAKTGGRIDLNKIHQGLLLFRNAPRSGGQSPAEMVFKSPIRDLLPTHDRAFRAEWQRPAQELIERREAARERNTHHYNIGTHELAAFDVGDHVTIQDPHSKRWNTKGIVIEVGPNRDYMVETAGRKTRRHNRRFLRLRVPVMPGTAAQGTTTTVAATPQQQDPLMVEPPAENPQQQALPVMEPHQQALLVEEPVNAPPAAPHRRRRANQPAMEPTRRSTRPKANPVYNTKDPASDWRK